MYRTWNAQIWDRLREVEAATQLICGPWDVQCARDEFVIISGVRNGELWLHTFFRHHDRLGPKHYFFFDNGSTDSTIEILRSRPNVTIVRCDLPFDQYYADFYRFVLWKFGREKWILWIDQDHQFDYPGSSIVGMPQLLKYLNQGGYTAVRSHIIDMFSDAALGELRCSPEDDLRTKYPFCDLSDLWAIPDPYLEHNSGPGREISYLTGGIRKTAFGTDWIYLTCHPLAFDGASIYLPNGHSVAGARIADFSAMIWHYKFLNNFYEIAEGLRAKWKAELDSACTEAIFREQQAFVSKFEDNPRMKLTSEKSIKPSSVDDFLVLGILKVSPEYRALVRSELQKSNLLAEDRPR